MSGPAHSPDGIPNSRHGQDADPDRRRAYARQWRENNQERIAQRRTAWREANPERVREQARRAGRRQTEKRRRLKEKRAAGRAYYAEHKDEQRARARRFRQDHPEKVREYHQRWRAKNPEHAKAIARRSSETHRDRHGDVIRERGRAAAAARRERDPDAYRRWYEQNLEAQRARGREASQLRARLKKLNLPPRNIRRVYAETKRANTASANEFFARRWDPRALRRISNPAAGWQVRAETARTSEQRLQERRAADSFLLRLPALLRHAHERYGDRIRDEVTMDSIARVSRGADPYDISHETGRRILRDLIEQEAPAIEAERIAQMVALMRGDRPGSAPGADTITGTRSRHTLDELQRAVDRNARQVANSSTARRHLSGADTPPRISPAPAPRARGPRL